MGRRIPSSTASPIDPALSLSLLVASVAATIAIIAGLCAARSRKNTAQASTLSCRSNASKRVPEPEAAATPSPSPSPPTQQEATTPPFGNTKSSSAEDLKTNFQVPQDLQPPPSSLANGAELSPSSRFSSIRAKSRRKLSSSLSMKLPTGNAIAKIKAKKEEFEQQRRDKKEGDSLWKKTIILGEKCKVPDEEDAIIYDNSGKRIQSYPSRTPRSLPVSRTQSLIDQDYQNM